MTYRGLNFSSACAPPGHVGMYGLRLVGVGVAVLADGSYFGTGIGCLGGDAQTPTQHKVGGTAASIIGFTSSDGYTWDYRAPVFTAAAFKTVIGPTEHDVVVRGDHERLYAVVRADGNGLPCWSEAYHEYQAVVSTNRGLSWSRPQSVRGAGCVRPKLLSLDHVTLLSGGRLCTENVSDNFVWVAKKESTDDDAWRRYSLSAAHNELWAGAPSLRFSDSVNTTDASGRTLATLSYTSLLKGADGSATVVYGMYANYQGVPGANLAFSMRLRVKTDEASQRRVSMGFDATAVTVSQPNRAKWVMNGGEVLTEWLTTGAAKGSINSLQPCCGAFYIAPTNFAGGGPLTNPMTFYPSNSSNHVDGQGRMLTGPPYFATKEQRAAGMELLPWGALSMGPDNVTDMSVVTHQVVQFCKEHNWAGIALDYEPLTTSKYTRDHNITGLSAFTVTRYLWLLGNLSAGMTAAGLHVATAGSDWSVPPTVGGPPYLAQYAAVPGLRLFDMSTYGAHCCVPGCIERSCSNISSLGRIAALKAQGIDLKQVALGIGMPIKAGWENGTCATCNPHECAPSDHCPHCDGKDPTKPARFGSCCGCFTYGWTQPELRSLLRAFEQEGGEELFVWRSDGVPSVNLQLWPVGTSLPRGGTTDAVPGWFLGELRAFLQRGERHRGSQSVPV
eukprot:SAG22_NODE_2466_length_2540_cov_2.037280_1_plen_672_part_00